MRFSEKAIIELNLTDSTNNYAMRLIDGNKAYNGLTVIAQSQTNGKGQRGNNWVDAPGDSLLMSIIVLPKHNISQQFEFLASVATAVVEELRFFFKVDNVFLKWPNDIVIHDKKAGGILIENVIRGNKWNYSIVGLGLNIFQKQFPPDLPFATSLSRELHPEIDNNLLKTKIRERILMNVHETVEVVPPFLKYNAFLYGRGDIKKFSDRSGSWYAKIIEVLPSGVLVLKKDNELETHYIHGEIKWEWT